MHGPPCIQSRISQSTSDFFLNFIKLGFEPTFGDQVKLAYSVRQWQNWTEKYVAFTQNGNFRGCNSWLFFFYDLLVWYLLFSEFRKVQRWLHQQNVLEVISDAKLQIAVSKDAAIHVFSWSILWRYILSKISHWKWETGWAWKLKDVK